MFRQLKAALLKQGSFFFRVVHTASRRRPRTTGRPRDAVRTCRSVPATVDKSGAWSVECSGNDRILFVASTGGHLAQLVRISKTFAYHPNSTWVTFENEQSRTLLAGERKVFVPYVKPRGYSGVAKAFTTVAGRLHSQSFDMCLTTGAGVALGVLVWARMKRIPCAYVESVSRTDGPSLTGRIVRRLNLADTYCQHAVWAGDGWRLHRSVLASFASAELPRRLGGCRPKVFVTLGTIKPYRFDALIDNVIRAGIADSSTVWQLGETRRTGLPGKTYDYVSAPMFEALCKEADVVITHAGVGTILGLLDSGSHPIVVPRRASRDEHVDDHQLQIARLVASVGVATVREVDQLSHLDVESAARLETVARSTGGPV